MVQLTDYQRRAVEWLCRCKRGLVQAPAGSGKTIIAAGALDSVRRARRRARKIIILWVANTIEQCEQARSAIDAFPDLAESLDITICCAAGAPATGEWDCIIVDECHHLTAPSWLVIIARHAGALWCFTATPWGDDRERNAALLRLVDGNVHVIPRSAVQDRVVPAVVHLLNDTDEGLAADIDDEIERMVDIRLRARGAIPESEIRRQVAYLACLQIGVFPNVKRNAAIVRSARRHSEQGEATLVLVSSIEHGQALAKEIPGSTLAFSRMGRKARRAAVNGFREGRVPCLLATSLADEGLDTPIASVLVLATAGRSAAKLEQRTGRVLRVHAGKSFGAIYDFADPQHSLLAWQSRKRRTIYERLGYRVIIGTPEQGGSS